MTISQLISPSTSTNHSPSSSRWPARNGLIKWTVLAERLELVIRPDQCSAMCTKCFFLVWTVGHFPITLQQKAAVVYSAYLHLCLNCQDLFDGEVSPVILSLDLIISVCGRGNERYVPSTIDLIRLYSLLLLAISRSWQISTVLSRITCWDHWWRVEPGRWLIEIKASWPSFCFSVSHINCCLC